MGKVANYDQRTIHTPKLKFRLSNLMMFL